MTIAGPKDSGSNRPRTEDQGPGDKGPKVGTGGTTTRRSTTGRTRRRCSGVTWRSGSGWPPRRTAGARAWMRHGRHLVPVAKAGAAIVGIDRSAAMLARAAAAGARGLRARGWCAATSARCRSAPATFHLVMAPYGMLQSLTSEAICGDARVGRAGVLRGAGCSASTSCPTCRGGPNTTGARACRGAAGGPRHPRRIGAAGSAREASRCSTRNTRAPRRGTRVHRFSLTFRTLSVRQMRPASSARASGSTPSSATTRAAPGTSAPTSG